MASIFVMFMRFGIKVWDLERHCVTFQCSFVIGVLEFEQHCVIL